MTTTTQFIDAVKAKTGVASDYALAPILGVTRGTISNYRNEKTFLDEEVALKVASILEIEPFEVLLHIQAERTKSSAAKAAYQTLFERLGGVAAAVTFGIMLNAPIDARADTTDTQSLQHNSTNLYIIRNKLYYFAE